MRAEGEEIRVLLVDDHPVLRFGLQVIGHLDSRLRIAGEAGTMEEGRRKIERLKPDVVLLDLRLPDGDGLDLCRETQGKAGRPRFICLTSYSEPTLVVAAMAAGVDGYLLKHNAAEKIVEAIHSVMRGGMALDPEVASTAAGASGGDVAREGGGRLAVEPGGDPLGHLSPTERRVLAEVAEGLTDKEVATAVGISVKSVRKRLAGIFQKLGVHSRTQAARKHAWGRGS